MISNPNIKDIDKYICISSAILKHKGISEFINIFNTYIKNYNSDIKLIILGNGPYLHNCKKLCNKLSISWSNEKLYKANKKK